MKASEASGKASRRSRAFAQLELNFCFSAYSISDEGLRSFGEGLKALKSVAQLELNFGGLQIHRR